MRGTVFASKYTSINFRLHVYEVLFVPCSSFNIFLDIPASNSSSGKEGNHLNSKNKRMYMYKVRVQALQILFHIKICMYARKRSPALHDHYHYLRTQICFYYKFIIISLIHALFNFFFLFIVSSSHCSFVNVFYMHFWLYIVVTYKKPPPVPIPSIDGKEPDATPNNSTDDLGKQKKGKQNTKNTNFWLHFPI